MLEFYKRAWQVSFPVFAALLVGMVQVVIFLSDRWYMPFMAISLAALALLFLVIALTCLVEDYQEARRKDKEVKAPSVYEKRGIKSL